MTSSSPNGGGGPRANTRVVEGVPTGGAGSTGYAAGLGGDPLSQPLRGCQLPRWGSN
ncbi:MAG: hypothetical protein K0R83_343 [Caulobacter sp.]|jgi:hypothetical protein|nr:hypothetical protein [Caulobacter sp.]